MGVLVSLAPRAPLSGPDRARLLRRSAASASASAARKPTCLSPDHRYRAEVQLPFGSAVCDCALEGNPTSARPIQTAAKIGTHVKFASRLIICSLDEGPTLSTGPGIARHLG